MSDYKWHILNILSEYSPNLATISHKSQKCYFLWISIKVLNFYLKRIWWIWSVKNTRCKKDRKENALKQFTVKFLKGYSKSGWVFTKTFCSSTHDTDCIIQFFFIKLYGARASSYMLRLGYLVLFKNEFLPFLSTIKGDDISKSN